MHLFYIAILSPIAALLAGVIWGGIWVAGAVILITIVTWGLDRLLQGDAVRLPPGSEFPTGTALSVGLGLVQVPLVLAAIWAIGGTSGHSIAERLGLLIGFGLYFGQVSHPTAHELIHKPRRGQQMLGRLVYISILFGHHASAHLRVHHHHVATANDPNSAPLGLGFYRFALRAWRQSFLFGARAETALRARSARHRSPLSHPYLAYVAGAGIMLALAGAIAGWSGLVALLGLATYAQIQILLSDYVQHYGLQRKLIENRPEPVAVHHSWNTPHTWSSAMMLNAPRHSDHHVDPTRPFPALRLNQQMPILPYSLPVMAVIALYPRLWRRIMDPRVAVFSPHTEQP